MTSGPGDPTRPPTVSGWPSAPRPAAPGYGRPPVEDATPDEAEVERRPADDDRVAGRSDYRDPRPPPAAPPPPASTPPAGSSYGPPPVTGARSVGSLPPPPSSSAATTSTATSGTAPRRPLTVGTAATTRKAGRRARLTVKRIDPWSTLKFAFIYGLAGMIVLLVAVVVLYSIVDAMGVLDSMRSFVSTVDDTGSSNITQWFGFGRVLLVTIVIGVVNVVLFTAFATLTAFVYNVCTDLVGGVEITLAERG